MASELPTSFIGKAQGREKIPIQIKKIWCMVDIKLDPKY